jgi:hypothetical protein
MTKRKAPPRFELGISCLLDRRFNQLSHGALVVQLACNTPHTGHMETWPVPKIAKSKTCAPNVGLEPTTLRLRVSCSTD